MDTKKLIANYQDELIHLVQSVIHYDTVQREVEPGAPFGQNTADCLDYVLKVCQEFGFRTKNCDGYVGYADYGTEGDLFGVLGHLDVVPVNPEEWKVPPFSGEIVDGKIYGRGTSDDKGPMMAALIALKAIKDQNLQLSKRIRLIFGCNEESGMACMRHYVKNEELPAMAISPDGEFPVINGEKGIYSMIAMCGKPNENVLSIKAGTRLNIVPDKCVAEIRKGADVAMLRSYGIEVEEKEDRLVLTTRGVAAHGSTPELGQNATWPIFRALAKAYPEDEVLQFVANKVCVDTNAVAWGFPMEDAQSGKLTVNLGTVELKDGVLMLGLDNRFPVTVTGKQLAEAYREHSPAFFRIMGGHASEPLWVDPSSTLVKTLVEVYEEHTGDKTGPIAIGGGTYSRMLPLCVAYGPNFPGGEKVEHMSNEYIAIDRLMQMTEIYYDAFVRLCK